MVAGVSHTLAETIGCKGDELRLWVNEEHLLRTLLLQRSEATESRTLLWGVFARLNAVQNMLCFGFIVDAGIVAPTV